MHEHASEGKAGEMLGIAADAAVADAVREVRFAGRVFCLHCNSRHVVRWGRKAGRQRFRCRECRRTFSDMTGTPAAYTKRLDRWPAHLRNLAEGGTAECAARTVGVSPRTILRWRQRTLATLARGFIPACGGRIEVARSGPFTYPPYIIALDDAGRSFIYFVRWNGGPWVQDRLISRRLLPGSTVICCDRRNSPFARAIVRAGLRYIRAERCPCPRTAGPHITDSSALRLRGEFIRWQGQFRGVWDRYVVDYALWFELRRRYPDQRALVERVLESWRPGPGDGQGSA